MDVNTIQTAISTLGFPVVCVLFLGWFIWKIWMSQQDQNKEREDKLYEYLGKAQAVNEQLTKTNSEFVEVLHSYKSDLDTIKNDVTEIKQNMKG
nr:MAG TPA: holin family protein [Caudoviricetes sp.]